MINNIEAIKLLVDSVSEKEKEAIKITKYTTEERKLYAPDVNINQIQHELNHIRHQRKLIKESLEEVIDSFERIQEYQFDRNIKRMFKD